MNERIDLAEAQQGVARLLSENGKHRVRPKYASAGKIPIPQSATTAIERRIDARAHRLVDHVGLARAGRLPVEGEAEDQHDETGGGRQRDRQRGIGHPGGERLAAPVHDGKLAVRAEQAAHRAKGQAAVSKRELQYAGGGAKRGERLARPKHFIKPTPEHRRFERRRSDRRAIAGSNGLVTQPGNDHASAVGDEHSPAGSAPPERNDPFQLGLQPQVRAGYLGFRTLQPLQPLGKEIGAGFDLFDDIADRLAAVIQHLHDCTHANRQEKGDDQHRDRTSQGRLGGKQPPISRSGDGLGEPLD